MKVFATLATILGASTATPLFQNQLQVLNDMRINHHSMKNVMKPSMGMSMESQMSQRGSSDRRMDMNHQMSTIRDMYRDNQDVRSDKMTQEMRSNMMSQEKSLNMRGMDQQSQDFGPNQYFVKDDFGNYVYSYNDQQSEKSEEGNNQAIKGQYTYIMSNGVKRRVEYLADNNGFHIIRDNADPARIKRSVQPDLVQTRMTSVMDSSSLRDDTLDLYRMANMMVPRMSSKVDRNMMDAEQQRYSNMIGRNTMDQNIMGNSMMHRNAIGHNIMDQNTMGHNKMDQNTMGLNMMGGKIYKIMSNRGMNSDLSNLMDLKPKIMRQDMNMNIMGGKINGQDMTSQMMAGNMLGQQRMTPNMMYSNMMGQDMSNNQMTSIMMNSHALPTYMLNSHSSNGLTGQHMMQKMDLEQAPETFISTRLF